MLALGSDATSQVFSEEFIGGFLLVVGLVKGVQRVELADGVSVQLLNIGTGFGSDRFLVVGKEEAAEFLL